MCGTGSSWRGQGFFDSAVPFGTAALRMTDWIDVVCDGCHGSQALGMCGTGSSWRGQGFFDSAVPFGTAALRMTDGLMLSVMDVTGSQALGVCADRGSSWRGQGFFDSAVPFGTALRPTRLVWRCAQMDVRESGLGHVRNGEFVARAGILRLRRALRHGCAQNDKFGLMLSVMDVTGVRPWACAEPGSSWRGQGSSTPAVPFGAAALRMTDWIDVVCDGCPGSQALNMCGTGSSWRGQGFFDSAVCPSRIAPLRRMTNLDFDVVCDGCHGSQALGMCGTGSSWRGQGFFDSAVPFGTAALRMTD